MKMLKIMGMLLLLLPIGCANMSGRSKSDLFTEVHRAYRLALRDADFKAASMVVDEATQTDAIDFSQFENIKVVRYKIVNSKPSDDGNKIHQEVELQYYFQNRMVVKRLQDNQVWQYQPNEKNWLLQTGLPKFK